jgi:hypothetical protein
VPLLTAVNCCYLTVAVGSSKGMYYAVHNKPVTRVLIAEELAGLPGRFIPYLSAPAH